MRASNRGGWNSSLAAWARTRPGSGEEPGRAARARGAGLPRAALAAPFGPATVADLKWWLGSTVTAARQALADVGAVEVDLHGEPGVVLPDDLEPVAALEPHAALLPGLDPTTMGWFQRDWYLGAHRAAIFDTNGNAGTTAWWDGRIVGGWNQAPDGEVSLAASEDVGVDAVAALEREAARLTAWLGGVGGAPLPVAAVVLGSRPAPTNDDVQIAACQAWGSTRLVDDGRTSRRRGRGRTACSASTGRAVAAPLRRGRDLLHDRAGGIDRRGAPRSRRSRRGPVSGAARCRGWSTAAAGQRPGPRRRARAIDELGYVPNCAARSLVTRRTDCIALVVSESEDRVFAELFFAGVVRGVSAEIAATDFQLWLAMINAPPTASGWAASYRPARRRRPAAVAARRRLAAPDARGRGRRRCSEAGRPASRPPATSTSTTTRAPALPSTTWCPGAGAGSPRSPARRTCWPAARLEGYREALHRAGLDALDDLVAHGQFSERGGRVAMEDLLARHGDIDAVLAASDPMAFGAARHPRGGAPHPRGHRGGRLRRVARRSRLRAALTTVDQPAEAMGRHMARLLLARIDGRPAEQPAVILVPDLVVRSST